MKKLALIVIIISATVLVAAKVVIQAATVTVTATVNDTSIIVSGYTLKNAVVYITENGTTIGTTTADVNGFYTKTISGPNVGPHTYGIYATSGTLTTAISTITTAAILQTIVNASANTAPKLLTPSSTRNPGQDLYVDGYGPPNASVVVTTSPQTQTLVGTTDGNGYFSVRLATNDMPYGTYTVNVLTNINAQRQSATSSFTLYVLQPTSSTSGSTTTPSPTPTPPSLIGSLLTQVGNLTGLIPVSGGASALQCEYGFAVCLFYDAAGGTLDIDRYMSEFLVYYGKPVPRDTSTAADLNGDGLVDGQDLSIFLHFAFTPARVSGYGGQALDLSLNPIPNTLQDLNRVNSPSSGMSVPDIMRKLALAAIAAAAIAIVSLFVINTILPRVLQNAKLTTSQTPHSRHSTRNTVALCIVTFVIVYYLLNFLTSQITPYSPIYSIDRPIDFKLSSKTLNSYANVVDFEIQYDPRSLRYDSSKNNRQLDVTVINTAPGRLRVLLGSKKLTHLLQDLTITFTPLKRGDTKLSLTATTRAYMNDARGTPQIPRTQSVVIKIQ